MIEPSSFIVLITDTLSAVVKILNTNSSLPLNEMLQPTLETIFNALETFYVVKLEKATSKYAKKRIKVDIKVLLKELRSNDIINLSDEFIETHLMLTNPSDSVIK